MSVQSHNHEFVAFEVTVKEFYDYIMSNSKIVEANLQKLLNDYKSSLYELINKSLVRISDLYLNNFVSEVSSSLNAAIDFEPSSTLSDKTKMSRNLRQLITKLERYINFLKDNEKFKTRFFEIGDGVAISRRRKKKDE